MAGAIMDRRIIIGADGLGVGLKRTLCEHLAAKGWNVTDLGDMADYPDMAIALSKRVASGEFTRGVLICGTGAGMAITANKMPGIRAVCVTDPYTAERAVASNNAQIITLGALVTGAPVATMLVDIWLANEFQGGNSARKVGKIEQARYA